MSKIAVIINPIAGGGQGEKSWQVLEPGLKAIFDEIVYRMSNRVDDLTVMTESLLVEKPDYLLIIGGDGTLNHVLNGLMENDRLRSPGTKVAFFNTGCGGDFIRQFPEQKVTEFLDRLSHNQSIETNVCKISFPDKSLRYYINISSCGMSGYVVAATAKSKWLKKLGGTVNYLIHSLIALIRYRKSTVRIQIDDALPFECPLLLAAVCNGQYFGGRMHVAPMAKVNDGLLDVVLFQNFTKLEALIKMRKIYSGAHLLDENVHYLQAKKVRIESLESQRIKIEADGESVGILPAVFEVIGGTIPLIV